MIGTDDIVCASTGVVVPFVVTVVVVKLWRGEVFPSLLLVGVLFYLISVRDRR